MVAITTATIPTTPIVNAGLLYVNDLTLSYTTTTTITLSQGAARDSTDTNDIILSAPVVIDIEKSGPGGIDVGITDYSTDYAVYAIADSTGYNQPSGIISLSATKPMLPGGYDMYRRIGWIVTGASLPLHILKFYQYGTDETRVYYYDIGIDTLNFVLIGGVATTFTEVTLEPIVPQIETKVIFRAEYTQANTINSAEFLPFGATSTIGMIRISAGAVSTQWQTIEIPCKLDDTTPAIKYKVGTSDSLNLYVAGYRDYL